MPVNQDAPPRDTHITERIEINRSALVPLPVTLQQSLVRQCIKHSRGAPPLVMNRLHKMAAHLNAANYVRAGNGQFPALNALLCPYLS